MKITEIFFYFECASTEQLLFLLSDGCLGSCAPHSVSACLTSLEDRKLRESLHLDVVLGVVLIFFRGDWYVQVYATSCMMIFVLFLFNLYFFNFSAVAFIFVLFFHLAEIHIIMVYAMLSCAYCRFFIYYNI